MPAGFLTRRVALLLPLALAACGGGDDDQAFEPLRFNYLPPIQLNVAAIQIEQRFVPSGVAPDVSGQDPEPPIAALRAMASDRLQAFGTANRAVFAILDATMAREGNVLRGSFAVSLTIYGDDGSQRGFAEARVQSRHSGSIDDLRAVLYDMTKSMMTDMNVEFEYQIHRNLKGWLTTAAAPDTPVQQAPLDGSPPPPQAPAPAPAPAAVPPDGSGAAPAPLAPAGPGEAPPPPGPVDTPAYPPSYLQLPPDQPQ
nr:hypothetical protein [uncultured Rhodopila sp.]